MIGGVCESPLTAMGELVPRVELLHIVVCGDGLATPPIALYIAEEGARDCMCDSGESVMAYLGVESW